MFTQSIMLYHIPMCLQEKLVKFMLACQDEETGGFADRPGDMVGIREGPFLCS